MFNIKNHLYSLLLLCLIVLTLPLYFACVGETDKTTILSSVQGEVMVVKAGSSNWVQAQVDMVMEVDDTIKVGAKSSAAITFFEGSIIELRANTQIEIRELLQGVNTAIRLRQEIGETVSTVIKMVDPASRYEIETPAAVAAVRGSQMRVHVEENGITKVQNIEGNIFVIALGTEVQIPPGNESTIIPGKKPGAPEPSSPQPSAQSTQTINNSSGLVLLAHLDESSGTFAQDSSGNGNDGTLLPGSNALSWVVGKLGNAISLNHNYSNYIDFGAKPGLNFGTGDFSASLWVQFNSFYDQQVLIEKYIEGMSSHSGWGIAVLAPDDIRVYATIETTTASVIDSNTNLQTGQWYHIVLTRSANIFTLYVNGNNKGSGDATRVNVDTGSSLKIGHRGSPSDTRGSNDIRGFYLDGKVDEVRIYSRALSSNEVMALYNY